MLLTDDQVHVPFIGFFNFVNGTLPGYYRFIRGASFTFRLLRGLCSAFSFSIVCFRMSRNDTGRNERSGAGRSDRASKYTCRKSRLGISAISRSGTGSTLDTR
jgi:hypothetical protein